jgi:RNA exonuclease 1
MGMDKIHTCCKQDFDSQGCEEGCYHVMDLFDPFEAFGFRETRPLPKSNREKFLVVYAVDCEMVYTTAGLELARVSLVGDDGESKYETLVLPDNPVLDYNTRFSGIQPGDLDNVTTRLSRVQEDLLNIVYSDTILLGHSLESDLKALKVS